MSTLDELVEQGELLPYSDAEQEAPPLRRLFLMKRAEPWFTGTLLEMSTTLSGGKINPAQQVHTLFDRFVSGLQLQYWTDFHGLRPIGYGAWEMKTLDTRVIGWFPARDTFVVASGHEALFVKEHGLYAGLAQETEAVRNRLNLDDPKFIPGDNPDDVVSNWNYAPC